MVNFIKIMVILLVASPLYAQKNLNPRVLGDAKAAITMVEYASFTCPHCAHFHNEILPKLKTDFIDTKKLKLVYDDFPLDGLALGVSMMARCIDNNAAYFAFVAQVFKTQKTWVESENPKEVLLKTLGFAGVSPQKVEQCLANKQLLEKITQARDNAGKLGVSSTPTLMVNQKIIQFKDYEDLKQQLLTIKVK